MDYLIKSNLLISTGCTEPIAIAYASAVARSYLKEVPSKISLKISKNMAKNTLCAGIPNSKFVGAAFVSALGALYANPDEGFKLLENISEKHHEIANRFAMENVKTEIANTDKALYIEVEMEGIRAKKQKNPCQTCNKVKIIVADGHNNINLIELNGNVIFKSCIDVPKNEKKDNKNIQFSIKEIFEYAKELKKLDIFKNSLDLNKKISDIGKNDNWGLNVGKNIPFRENTCLSRIISVTTSAIDARIAGAPYPAMTCTGSGNQGISTTLPVY